MTFELLRILRLRRASPEHILPSCLILLAPYLNLRLPASLLSANTSGLDGTMMNGLQAPKTLRGYFGNPDGRLLGTINAMVPLGELDVAFSPV